MKFGKYIIVFLAWALCSPALVMASNSVDAKNGIGLLLPIAKDAQILAKESWSFAAYAEPSKDSERVAYIIRKSLIEQEAVRAQMPDAFYVSEMGGGEKVGFFAKLMGKRGKAATYAPLREVAYETREGEEPIYGFVVYEVRGVWYRTSAGWIERDKVWAEETRYRDWKNLYASNADSRHSLFRMPNYEDAVPVSDLASMRHKTTYALLGEVQLRKGASHTAMGSVIAPPLRLAITQVKGDWVKVFAVISSCDKADGLSDYRDGATGWLHVTSQKGAAQIIRKEQECR